MRTDVKLGGNITFSKDDIQYNAIISPVNNGTDKQVTELVEKNGVLSCIVDSKVQKIPVLNKSNEFQGPIWFKDCEGIKINSNNKDLKIWEVVGNSGSYASQFGFYEKYLGTAAGNDNKLQLYADNQADTHKLVREIQQDGTAYYKTPIYIEGPGTFKDTIRAYRYNTNNNAPFITFDKPGTGAGGIGSNGTPMTIQFGSVSGWNSNTWDRNADDLHWRFRGDVTTTTNLNIKDKVTLEYNSTDECLEFIFK